MKLYFTFRVITTNLNLKRKSLTELLKQFGLKQDLIKNQPINRIQRHRYFILWL